MTTHDQPLTPEERGLAQRLARLGPHGEPSPALDAKILAAAHDAVAQHRDGMRQARARNARRRWPAGLGVAASLMLAVGIAWQLRPLPDADIADSTAPATAQTQQATRPPEPAASVESAGPPAAATRPMQANPRRIVDTDDVAPPTAAQVAAPAPPEQAPVAFDNAPLAEPAAASAQASAAAPPPAPPAFVPLPPATMADSAAGAMARPRATRDTGGPGAARRVEPSRDETKSAAAEAEAASEPDRLGITGAQRGDQGLPEPPLDDQPLDDQPPASADSVVVQQAWLQRIRDLIAEGRPDDARTSLREFKRRYPGVALPEDLRQFAAPSAP